MQLKLRRSQRSGGMLSNKVIFALDARAALTEEEKALAELAPVHVGCFAETAADRLTRGVFSGTRRTVKSGSSAG
jgi:hypothetical protein